MQMEPLMDARQMRNKPQTNADERRLNAKAGHEEREGKSLTDWPPRSLPGSSRNIRFTLRVLRASLRVLRVTASDFFVSAFIRVHLRLKMTFTGALYD